MKNAELTVDRWLIGSHGAIEWPASKDKRLPHRDHIEMSGRRVSVVAHFGVDSHGYLTLSRRVIWPTLRSNPQDVRGYLKQDFGDDCFPRIQFNDGRLSAVSPATIKRIQFDGVLTLVHCAEQGLQLTRHLCPCTSKAAAVEQCVMENVSDRPIKLRIVPLERRDCPNQSFVVEVSTTGSKDIELMPGNRVSFGVIFHGRRPGEAPLEIDTAAELELRRRWLASIALSLRLESPDEVLNRTFAFAKIRAAESVFETKMGLVHSPGGERYYGGVWANDQAEYAAPFFPFLGDQTANAATLNAYRIFARLMTPEYGALPSSVEVEGDVLFNGCGDRGDAAMIVYGATRFALATGDRGIGEELWPVIEWCLEYCRRKLTPEGVVASDTDELENRFPAGKANLCTSTLAYGGLLGAASLATALEKPAKVAEEYGRRAGALRAAIKRCFEATVEGFETYRYYDGNKTLRAWICLPLTMGILDRARGTIAALFSPRLWTADGLATEAGQETFWDRSTLHALRGVFVAGETEIAFGHLSAYSRRRLVGEHVPYPVEAHPEGDQAHLSAESALYCRVITEGLFGIVPTGFRGFACTPRLPQGWLGMKLCSVRAFGKDFDVVVNAAADNIRLSVEIAGKTVFAAVGRHDHTFHVKLP